MHEDEAQPGTAGDGQGQQEVKGGQAQGPAVDQGVQGAVAVVGGVGSVQGETDAQGEEKGAGQNKDGLEHDPLDVLGHAGFKDVGAAQDVDADGLLGLGR